MNGSPDDPFVYQHRWNYYGGVVPWKYSFRNAASGRGMKGAVLESVFMGTESQVRKSIEERRLPSLPWE